MMRRSSFRSEDATLNRREGQMATGLTSLQFERLDAHERFGRLGSLSGLPKIISCLLSQPDFGCTTMVTTQPSLDAQGHGWTDCSATVDDFRQRCTVDTQLGCCLAHTKPKRRQNVVTKADPRVGRVEHHIHLNLSDSPDNQQAQRHHLQTQKSVASWH